MPTHEWEFETKLEEHFRLMQISSVPRASISYISQDFYSVTLFCGEDSIGIDYRFDTYNAASKFVKESLHRIKSRVDSRFGVV